MFYENHPGPPIIYGWGAFRNIDRWLPEGNVFLVLGGASADILGIEERVRSNCKGKINIFRGIEPNPSSETVEIGADRLKNADVDLILAVGGGSVIDAAKFMAQIANRGGSVIEFVTGKITPEHLELPLIAVPTTPGTSSEITPFSVVTVPELNNKIGLRHPSIYPAKAVIDPELSIQLPPEQTAATGLDILSHAVESFWARKANRFTKELSLTAVKKVKEHLPGAFMDGTSREHREGISLASMFAGMSFANTGTTICHAISYPITMDTGLHHGMACALSLGPTYDLLRKKGIDDLEMIAEAFDSEPDTFSDDLTEFLVELNAPSRLEVVREKDWAERIMGTELENFRKNFKKELSSEDVKGIIGSMQGE
ncbi:MAG: iron-containing alcohol dehydrogenase [Candidatus Thermoplasmatota archaeon]|nr:iron-containing alcohol dehydrogenase [Candidatus Thermoplasmatota archaeon]